MLYRIEEEIIRDLLVRAQDLDRKIEQNVTRERPVYGLQVVPGMVLLLQHYVLKIGIFKAEELLSEFDHFILMFPDFLAIRAVRFSGKSKLNPNSSFLIYKLSKQKGRDSKIGEELVGSFITQGMLENVDISILQLLSPVLLALIRPFLKDGVLFPSSLSLIAHEILKQGVSKKAFLSPCTLTLILTDFKHQERFPVLGKELEGLLTHRGTVLAFNAQRETLESGHIRVFVPSRGSIDVDSYYTEYSERKRPVISHLLGMLVFEHGQPIMKPNMGYFLALQEVPLQLDTEALAIYGEPHGFSLRTTLSSNELRDFYYEIRCDKRKLDKLKQTVLEKILLIERKLNARSLITEPRITDIVRKELAPRILQSNNHYVGLLAPPLQALLLTEVHEADRLLNALEELIKLSSLSSKVDALLRLKDLKTKNPLIQKLIDKATGLWKYSLKCQRDFANKWGLSYLI